jgi:hypothetical protein
LGRCGGASPALSFIPPQVRDCVPPPWAWRMRQRSQRLSIVQGLDDFKKFHCHLISYLFSSYLEKKLSDPPLYEAGVICFFINRNTNRLFWGNEFVLYYVYHSILLLLTVALVTSRAQQICVIS